MPDFHSQNELRTLQPIPASEGVRIAADRSVLGPPENGSPDSFFKDQQHASREAGAAMVQEGTLPQLHLRRNNGPQDTSETPPEQPPQTAEQRRQQAVRDFGANTRIRQEVQNGQFSAETQARFRQFFQNNQELTPDQMADWLNELGAAINDHLPQGTRNHVGMGLFRDQNNNLRLHMTLRGPGMNDVTTAMQVTNNTDSPTQFLVGTVRIR